MHGQQNIYIKKKQYGSTLPPDAPRYLNEDGHVLRFPGFAPSTGRKKKLAHYHNVYQKSHTDCPGNTEIHHLAGDKPPASGDCLWRVKIIYITSKNPVPTSHSLTITAHAQLLLFRHKIAVCSDINKKAINTMCRHINEFLGAFAKLREANYSCVMFVRLSVRTEQPGPQWADFQEILYLSNFRKSADTFQVSIKSVSPSIFSIVVS